MFGQNVNYTINLNGNAMNSFKGITSQVEKLNKTANSCKGLFNDLGEKFFKINQTLQGFAGISQSIESILEPGIKLNSSLADLSAITGQTGKGLEDIEKRARSLAKTYGNSASESVESFKLILSQLSPDIANNSEALQKMGENVAVLSKSMGGDSVAATNVLTTAMNQFQVSLTDPIVASREMAKMMNVMAAAAKEGSAELPQIQQALQNAGMAAKSAGVSFEETNAAIQVLDKAGKKGAEGGVALRNVMTTLAKGRFLPEDVLKELKIAGVDISKLTDKSLSFSDRLKPLKNILGDTALVTKLFGTENSNAALALISGIDQMDAYAEAITGTNSAVDQSKIVMESFAERQKRFLQQIEDVKIGIFNLTGSAIIWVSNISKMLIPLSQLIPLFTAVNQGMTWSKNILGIVNRRWVVMNHNLEIGKIQSLGFFKNIGFATLGLIRFATKGLWAGIKAMGSYILSLVTGGAASAGFALTAKAGFATFKLSAVSACRAVSVAIVNIPIIGWIAGAIAVLVALGAYFYNTSENFRGFLDGLWQAIKVVFTGIGGFIWEVLQGIWHLIKGVFNPANWFDKSYSFGDGLKKISDAASKYGKSVGDAFRKGRDESLAKNAKKTGEDGAATEIIPPEANVGGAGKVINEDMAKMGGGSASESKIKNITIKIDNLINKLDINTTNLREDSSRVKDMITEIILSSMNELNTI